MVGCTVLDDALLAKLKQLSTVHLFAVGARVQQWRARTTVRLSKPGCLEFEYHWLSRMDRFVGPKREKETDRSNRENTMRAVNFSRA